MNPYHIRELQETDKTAMISLFNEFGSYLQQLDVPVLDLLVVPEDYGQKFYAKMVSDISTKQGKAFVVEVDAKVVGFVAGVMFDVGEEPDEFDCKPHKMGRVIELYINEAYRGQGIGTDLLNSIEVYFKTHGGFKVNIDVFAPNQRSYEFYLKHGYTPRNIDVVKLL
jgi:ribosomal protein S18 acetylase RimI-like enzyme